MVEFCLSTLSLKVQRLKCGPQYRPHIVNFLWHNLDVSLGADELTAEKFTKLQYHQLKQKDI